MTDDHDLLNQYFTDRSPQIDVPTVGVATIARRAQRRRHRRTGVKIGAVVGVLALGGAVLAQQGDDGKDNVASFGAAVVDSPLTWTTVDAPQGIGGFGLADGATTTDGSIYQLSTGPGTTFDTPEDAKRVLYRSTDGIGWSAASLPDGLSAAGLAAAGDRLYAVGTAPAGGGVGVRLASSTDGATWTEADLPLDLEALGGGITVTPTSTRVATANGTTVVTVSLRADLPESVLPDGAMQWGFETTATGIGVLIPCQPIDAEGKSGPSTTMVDGDGNPVTTTLAPSAPLAEGGESSDPAATEARPCDPAIGEGGPGITHRYTWADLGLSEAQGALVQGEVRLFATSGDGPLVEVGQLPAESGSGLIASPDGFWLLSYASASGTSGGKVRFSADGRSWDGAPFPLPGSASGAGLLGGRPTVVLDGDATRLAFLSPTGAQTVDLSATLGDQGDRSFVSSAVAFGPLGVAFTYTTDLDVDTGRGRTVVVHSADGITFGTVDLPAAPAGQRETVSNVSVSADAVTVRLNSYPEGAQPGVDGVRPTQRAFVGTPG